MQFRVPQRFTTLLIKETQVLLLIEGSFTLSLDQGSVNEIIKEIFKISTGFQGTLISQFAKVKLIS